MSVLHPEIRAFLLADYLRAEQPSWGSCFIRAVEFADARGLPRPRYAPARELCLGIPLEVLLAARCLEGARGACLSPRAPCSGPPALARPRRPLAHRIGDAAAIALFWCCVVVVAAFIAAVIWKATA